MESYSQIGQDLWVQETLKNKKNGYFLDIGAHDGIYLSNTYLLEKNYNWNGLCIEGNPLIVDSLKHFFVNRKEIQKSDFKILFLICCFLPCFILFELIPTKLPHYVMPVYTSLSILISVYMIKFKSNNFEMSWYHFTLLYFFPVIFIILYIFACFVYADKSPNIFLILFIIIYLIFMFFYLKKFSIKKLIFCTGFFQLFFYFSLVYSLNPKLEKFWISKEVNKIVLQKENLGKNIFHYGFNEPSLVFLIGHKSSRLEPELMLNIAKNKKNNLFILTEDANKQFLKNQNEEMSVKFADSFVGFNYSKGKFLKFFVYVN